jgi:hypothetical protein
VRFLAQAQPSTARSVPASNRRPGILQQALDALARADEHCTPPRPARLNQAGVAKDLQMAADRWLAHVEDSGHLHHTPWSREKLNQDVNSSRFGQYAEAVCHKSGVARLAHREQVAGGHSDVNVEGQQ